MRFSFTLLMAALLSATESADTDCTNIKSCAECYNDAACKWCEKTGDATAGSCVANAATCPTDHAVGADATCISDLQTCATCARVSKLVGNTLTWSLAPLNGGTFVTCATAPCGEGATCYTDCTDEGLSDEFKTAGTYGTSSAGALAGAIAAAATVGAAVLML